MKLPPNVCVTKVENPELDTVTYSVSFSMNVSVVVDVRNADSEYVNWALEQATIRLIDQVRTAVEEQ